MKLTSSRITRVLSLLLLLLCSACRELPHSGLERLRALRYELNAAEATRWVPKEVADFEERFVRIRETFVELNSRWSWFRSGEALDQLNRDIVDLHREGLKIARVSRQLKNEKIDQLKLEMAVLEDLLDPNFRRTLIPELRMRMTTANLHLARLRLHLEEGDPWSAEAALDELKESSREFRDYFEQLERRLEDPRLLDSWAGLCRKATALSQRERRGVLIVDKYHRKVVFLQDGKIVRKFDADLGWNGLNDKLRQGDGATPEGEYQVVKLKGEGQTQYHRALLLNYPNAADRRHFESLVQAGKLPRGTKIGGLIEIHGEGGRGEDWTEGCVALVNDDMDFLFKRAYPGMPVFVVGKCQTTQ